MKSKISPLLRTVSLATAATLLITLCVSTAHAAELVTNGDFSANAASFTGIPGYVGGSNPANPTGWTTTGQVGVNGSSAPYSVFAPATNVPTFLYIQGDSATASQALATTNGGNYLFSFDAAAGNGNTSGVNVFANDTQPASLVLNGFGGNNGWLSSTNFQRYAFGFTATGAQTIQFSGSGIGDHTTDITNVSVTDAVSSQLNIADGTLFFTETSGTHNYGFSLTGTNQTIYRRPGSATYTGNVTTDGSAGALTITANENDGGNNLTFSGSSITLGAKSLNVTGGNVDGPSESLNSKVTLTNATLTTDADVNVGRGSLEITGSTNLTIGGQLRSGAGGDWSTFIMNPGTSVTATGGVDFTANGVIAANLLLNGGTLTTPFIRGTSLGGNTNLIFNGTTVLASADSADFVQVRSNDPARIAGGGAIFDTNGKNITIQNTLANDGASQGTLTKQGSGTLQLTGANSYSGSTTVNAGTLEISTPAAINSSSKITVNSGAQIYFNPFTRNGTVTVPIELNGVGNGGSALRTYAEGAQLTFSGAITLLDSSMIEAYAGNSTLNFTNAIGGTGNLTFNGIAASPSHKNFMVLSGVSNFNGDLYIENYASSAQVTLSGGDNRLPTSAVVRIGAGQWTQDGGPAPATSSALDLNGNNQTIAGLSDSGSLVGARSVVNTSGTTATLSLNTTADQSFSGTIGGTDINGTAGNNLALVKSGTGTQTLTGVNTYTGDTTVTGGTLAVNGSSIKDTNKLIINGGKVDLTGAETVNTLFFGGVQQAAGTWGSSSSAAVAPFIDDTRFSGTGTLIVGPVAPYTTWADSFLPGNNVSNPAGDNDNDGLTNQQEFAFGLSPISGSSVNPIVVQLNKTTGQFSYQRRAASGLTYKILTSTTLATGSWTQDVTASQVAGATDGNGNQTVVVTLTGAPLAASKLFVRVAAE